MQDGFSYMALARRDHDFRVVETSREFSWSAAAKEEARWLALDWWGNSFVDNFTGALGHVISKASRDVFLLMLVQPGPIAPDRFVVFLTANEYRRFGYNPFRAAEHGVFGFTETFYRQRDESQYYIDWKERIQSSRAGEFISPETQRSYDRAVEHLVRGHSLIVPTHADTSELFKEFEDFTYSLFQEDLRGISIFTFTNTTTDKLNHFGTLLASVYSTTQSRTLSGILHDLVQVDNNGSPFMTIRRAENTQ